MKVSHWLLRRNVHAGTLASWLILILASSSQPARTQINNWLSPGSGDWESPEWSFGLPAMNEDIFITNAGTKTIVIEQTTTQYNPSILNIEALVLSSPPGSSNTLFFNFAGLQSPLTMANMSVGINAAVVMDRSSLNVTNAFGMDGTFTQDKSSIVAIYDLNVGTKNSATYFLDSGMLIANAENVGVSFPSLFEQEDGTNAVDTVGINASSEYDLLGGELDGSIKVFAGGTFRLETGLCNTAISADGDFIQSGGVITNSELGMSLPIPLGAGHQLGAVGTALQSGGTNNLSSLTLGIQQPALNQDTNQNVNFGGGTYTMTNGSLRTGNVSIWGNGSMEQTGGTHHVAETLSLQGSIYVASNNPDIYVINRTTSAGYSLSNGKLAVSNLSVGVAGAFIQLGGTDVVSNSLSFSSVQTPLGAGGNLTMVVGAYNLSGGVLSVSNVSGPVPGYASSGTNLIFVGTTSPELNQSGGLLIAQNISGNILQSGGTNTCTTISGNYSLNGGLLMVQGIAGTFQQSGGTNQAGNLVASYALSGGSLTVATNVQLTNGEVFQHSGGRFVIPSITLDNGTWRELTNGASLGPLQLGAGTNSIIQFPTNTCALQFADCSTVTWSNTGVLTIVGWHGSLTGAGTNILAFGSSSNALTSNQLSQIQFANPAGLTPGNYLANILSNGEIVPGVRNFLENPPAPFFTGEVSMGDGWYYLASSNHVFGNYNLQSFPYVLHLDMGWEYFVDADNPQHGGYFYDFTDNAFFYTEPGLFPYLYDFTAKAWVYYSPASETGRYTSNPRWFYNFTTQAWSNGL